MRSGIEEQKAAAIGLMGRPSRFTVAANGTWGSNTWRTVRPCLSVSNAFGTRRQLDILYTFILDLRVT